jgi:hypothetical protein
MFDYVRMPSDEGEFILRGYGWYHEDYIRTALGWRMKRSVERRQRVDMEGQVPKAVASLMNDSTP